MPRRLFSRSQLAAAILAIGSLAPLAPAVHAAATGTLVDGAHRDEAVSRLHLGADAATGVAAAAARADARAARAVRGPNAGDAGAAPPSLLSRPVGVLPAPAPPPALPAARALLVPTLHTRALAERDAAPKTSRGPPVGRSSSTSDHPMGARAGAFAHANDGPRPQSESIDGSNHDRDRKRNDQGDHDAVSRR